MMTDYLDNDVLENSNTADPNFNRLLYNLDLDQDVKARLSTYLRSVYLGNSDVYLSPIAKDHDPKSIQASWDKIFNANKHRINDVLIDLEISNRDKFGPRSIASSWKSRREGVYSYFEANKHPITLHNSRKGQGNLRPISYDKAIPFLKNNTNSGLPYFTRKSKIKNKLYDSRTINKLKLRKDPCILFTRTQENLKTRTVWGYPVYDTLNEMRYYRPLLGYQRNQGYRSALIGPEKVDKSITSLILRAVKDGLTLVSVDFSAYDASVGYGLQRAAFDYIKSLFQRKESDEIDFIFNRFNSIGLLTPDGVINGSHGVPSGSTFTNEVDSIVQYLIAMGTSLVMADNLQIQGDDGAYALIESDVETLFNSFRSMGLNLNESKSYRSKNFVIYLQKLFHMDYLENGLIGGIYPSYRAIERILFQERWSEFEDYGLTGRDYYSIRTISILENCKYHPLF